MPQFQYGRMDRLLHQLAFSSRGLQKIVAECEDSYLGEKLNAIQIDRPVFITSLPRAGTTLMLQILTGTDRFVSHRYSNMPFILCPLTWHYATSFLKRSVARKTRAHGDGMIIDARSPEAFEEVIWSSFWPEQYVSQQIILWETMQPRPEFKSFFVNHVKKLLYLSGFQTVPPNRYVSKNNANLVRLKLIREMFPDSLIVVPFRAPLTQSGSMHMQHLNFLAHHRTDTFAKKYMAYLGHYEFGELLKPIAFDGRRYSVQNANPGQPEFWLQYWSSAFSYVLDNQIPELFLFDYDRMLTDPRRSLEMLAGKLGESWSERWARQVAGIRRPPDENGGAKNVDVPGLSRANNVHQMLKVRAINS